MPTDNPVPHDSIPLANHRKRQSSTYLTQLQINNVRVKAKKIAGQFEPRSVLDVVASLDDIVVRGKAAAPLLPELVSLHDRATAFWKGLGHPVNPRDCGQ